MSEEDAIELLTVLGGKHYPPEINPDQLTLHERSVRYWCEVSDQWLLSEFSVNLRPAFENGRLVHLMVWSWGDEDYVDNGYIRFDNIKEIQLKPREIGTRLKWIEFQKSDDNPLDHPAMSPLA